jgi:hypothetical protein
MDPHSSNKMQVFIDTGSSSSPSNRASATEPSPSLELHNPLHFPSNATLGFNMTSLAPITINNITIWSSTPIQILRNDTKEELVVKPDGGLGSAFVDGWNKLPDELKVRELSCNLVAENTISFEDTQTDASTEHVINFDHHLRTTPEIASLSREISYTKNTFLLQASPHSNWETAGAMQIAPTGFMNHPPTAATSYIRSLELRLPINSVSSRFLTRLINGQYGLQDLRHLRLTIPVYWFKLRDMGTFDVFMLNIIGEGLEFACNGSCEIIGLEMGNTLTETERDNLQSMKERLANNIRFGCSAKKRGLLV